MGLRLRRRDRRASQPAVQPALPAVRVEQALVTLAVHTQQLDTRLASIESRVAACEAAAAELPFELDVPTHDDLLDVRMHAAKLAAELSRVQVNMYARFDDLRARQERGARGDEAVVDLRRAPGDWATTA